MEVVATRDDFRKATASARSVGSGGSASSASSVGGRLGLVPTMGALHDGHLSLFRAAVGSCDVVAASIFVNPLQFASDDDRAQYPSDLEHDLSLAEAAGVEIVFAPSVTEMYPDGPPATVIDPGPLAARLEGASRPGHFAGVATVVTKLLSLAGPCRAFFGEKDFQQLAIVRQVAEDLDLPADIVGCPTVREPDGLACSSRNRRLGPEDRRARRQYFSRRSGQVVGPSQPAPLARQRSRRRWPPRLPLSRRRTFGLCSSRGRGDLRGSGDARRRASAPHRRRRGAGPADRQRRASRAHRAALREVSSQQPLDVLVVGSGVAGLSAAVRLAQLGGARVGVLTKGELEQSTTRWAQGGVAAVLPGDEDSTDLHLADTLRAGAGLCDQAAVRVLVDEGSVRVHELIALGAVFDRVPGGELSRAREGGHSTARVLHAGGTATGAEVERALVTAVRDSAAAILEECFVLDLVIERGRCTGVVALDPAGELQRVGASHVVLACGGAGQLYAVTTNPTEATGDGIAMALRAGVPVADVEFMQFHPTALHHPAMPRPLISEALRGHGAVLRDRGGNVSWTSCCRATS